MVRIEILTKFKRAGQVFYPGEVRMVDEAEARHVCGAGWARSAEFATDVPETSEKILDVHCSTFGQSVSKIGGR